MQKIIPLVTNGNAILREEKNAFKVLWMNNSHVSEVSRAVKLHHEAIVLLSCICSSQGLIKLPFQRMENDS